MQSLGFALRDEAWLTTLTNDVLNTSEIEGEHFKHIAPTTCCHRLSPD
jgi:hypothetical protein